MTNLTKLSVSLTKHGAHKIATLLKNSPANKILTNLNGSISNVYIDRTQAQKNLSAQNGTVPAVWSSIQALGSDAIDSLVLVSIIFSHRKLIDVMTQSTTGALVGTIKRGVGLKGKEFTNFSHTLEQLGFLVAQSYEQISYNISKISSPQYGAFARILIGYKLTTAGWKGSNSVEDEAISLDLHRALAMTEFEFRAWLQGVQPAVAVSNLPIEDEGFFANASDLPLVSQFKFTPGHTQRVEGKVAVKAPTDKATAELLHNKIQNALYAFLEKSHGKGNVGTEVDTGDGTSIDVVLKKDEVFWFYEIKTALSVKATIRQALPQLLEYAYWPDAIKAERLIIVSHLPPKPITERYLKTLRERFGVPVYYQHFCLDSHVLLNNI